MSDDCGCVEHYLMRPGSHVRDCRMAPIAPINAKARRRYVVELDVPDRRRGHWATVELGSFRKLETAKRRLERVLERHPSWFTRQGGGERFPFGGRVVDLKGRTRDAQTAVYMDAPHRLVPSVADVGWW